MNTINRNWVRFLSLAMLAGILLRVLYVDDMEYKEDEEYNFTQTQLIGVTQPWPWYGIPSGVYLVNPGMSIWVFTVLAKIFGIHQPTSLAHAVQGFALLGMSLIIPFVLFFLREKDSQIAIQKDSTQTLLGEKISAHQTAPDQSTWLWAFALAMVNPFLVLYQRKLWPEPFLPFFTMLTLMGWWRRTTWLGAVVWGFFGAWLGQIHMSGFFFSFALFLWTGAFDSRKKEVSWKFWFLGSCLGALPLLPWAKYVLGHPVGGTMTVGWNEIFQFKYWAFWFTDPLGLHLGNPLGLLRGDSNWAQISDFIRYPLIPGGQGGSSASYIVGLAHLGALVASIWIFARGISSLWKARSQWKELLQGKSSPTAFLQNSALWGCGILLTITGVVIRRYYMTVTFPLEFILLIRMARPETKIGRGLLIALWIFQLFISAGFVNYIHVNEGSVQGDYGQAYHLIRDRVLK